MLIIEVDGCPILGREVTSKYDFNTTLFCNYDLHLSKELYFLKPYAYTVLILFFLFKLILK